MINRQQRLNETSDEETDYCVRFLDKSQAEPNHDRPFVSSSRDSSTV